MELDIDGDLQYTVKDKGCDPIIFVPDIDLFTVDDESIIDVF